MQQMDLEEIGRVAGRECARQQVDLEAMRRLLAAYEYVLKGPIFKGNPVQITMEIRELFYMVEPKTRGQLRRTPVTFKNGGTSCPPSEVAFVFARLAENLPRVGTSTEDEVDPWLKHFLWVHPCTDGNGRLAWLLYNYFGDNMHHPLPLPDYFGEEIG